MPARASNLSRSTPTRARSLVAVLALVGALTLTLQARAQTEMTMIYGGSEPTFSATDIQLLFQAVNLSDDQAKIITSIHAGYAQSHRAVYAGIAEQVSAIDKQLRQTDLTLDRRIALNEDLNFVRQSGREQCRDLEINFVTDLKALLDQSQLDQYQRFERDRRRRLTLRIGPVFEGEKLDLAALAEKLDPAARTAIDALLDNYASELDPVLIQRNDLIDRIENASNKPGVKNDPGNMNNMYRQSLAIHLQVRDITWRWMDQIAHTLPHDQAAPWQRRFFQAGWPSLCGLTTADEAFEKAMSLPTVAQTQRDALKAMRNSFNDQVVGIERQVIEIQRQNNRQARLDPGNPPEPTDRIDQLLNQRQLLADEFVIQIRSVLTPSQQTELQVRAAPVRSILRDPDRYNSTGNAAGQYAIRAPRCPLKEHS